MDDSFLEAYKKAREQKAGNQPVPQASSTTTEPTANDAAGQTVAPAQPVVTEPQPAVPVETAPPVAPVTPSASQAEPTPAAVQPSTSEPAPAAETKPMPSFLHSEAKPEVVTPAPEVKPEKPVKEKKPRKLGSRTMVLAALLLLMILIAGLAYTQRDVLVRGINSYKHKATPRPTVQTPSEADQALARNYITEVGKLMELPAGENPTVAAITDVAKLRSSENGNLPIFQKAKNGDVLIIYSTKAILYDPAKKVIVDVANVNIAKPQTATSSATPATATPIATVAPTAKPATVVPPTTQTATTSATQ